MSYLRAKQESGELLKKMSKIEAERRDFANFILSPKDVLYWKKLVVNLVVLRVLQIAYIQDPPLRRLLRFLIIKVWTQ